MGKDAKLKEIEKNLDFFLKELPKIKKGNEVKYALLRHQKVIGIYDTVADAETTGKNFFEDRMFSIQKIDATSINLGYFSYAMHMAPAG